MRFMRIISPLAVLSLLMVMAFGMTLGSANSSWTDSLTVGPNIFQTAKVDIALDEGSSAACPNQNNLIDPDTGEGGILPGQTQDLSDCVVQNAGTVPVTILVHITGDSAAICSAANFIANADGIDLTHSGESMVNWETAKYGLVSQVLNPGQSVTLHYGAQLQDGTDQTGNEGQQCAYTAVVSAES